MRYVFLFLCVFSCQLNAAEPTVWDKVRMEGLTPGNYEVSSGTGFFITPRHIITNAHVVQHCLTIAVRGAIAPTRVELMALDNTVDLAILKSPVTAEHVAYLRSNGGAKTGDRVFVMGYPLESGETGQYLLVDAVITGFEGAFETAPRLTITQVVEQGNSGGPLMDGGGNVIGVIVAKETAFWEKHNLTTGEIQRTEQSSGVAIGLPVLRSFLQRYSLFPRGNSTYDMFTEYRPDRRAQEYIVNIHCMMK